MPNTKHTYNLKWSLAYLMILISSVLKAVPATPYPHTVIQEDGSELKIYLHGDEHFSYYLTEDGFLIDKDIDGCFKYAYQDDKGIIQTTNVQAHPKEKRSKVEQTYLQKQQQYPNFRKKHFERKTQRMMAAPATFKQKSFPTTDSPKTIVILVNFADVAFVTPSPQKSFSKMLNEEGYADNKATGSARDYFISASNGISSPEFVVVGPYTLPENRAYYGGNDAWGDDIRPREMVVHACQLAAENGVDFSEYDTDNDGVVDNVFVYYAGHNEAEHGPKESIWPHRWTLDTLIILNGVRVFGYACSSELRGASGKNMCSIGTFVHEFGHVYGLPDYYDTTLSSRHTLGSWNVMDSGMYLNEGRTPPTYSAFDRFYLGWLTPKLLSYPETINLKDLENNNEAYIITHNKEHNFKGNNPHPKEFIMLENRQQTGWDSYLPGHGMLISRILYNKSTWEENTVNNNPNTLGYSIIHADGIASKNNLAGDPFPGTSNVTEFHPSLSDGTDIGQPITEIEELGGDIRFSYMGGGGEDLNRFINKNKTLKVVIDTENKTLYIDKGKINSQDAEIYIYNLQGIILKRIESKNQNLQIDLNTTILPKNEWLIIKAGYQSIKIKL